MIVVGTSFRDDHSMVRMHEKEVCTEADPGTCSSPSSSGSNILKELMNDCVTNVWPFYMHYYFHEFNQKPGSKPFVMVQG